MLSGIAVIFQRDGRTVKRREIERVASALFMYGRDKKIVQIFGHVAFAYTHFTDTPQSIGQYQPVKCAGGRFILVFDGRLDNREDLAAELGIFSDELAMLSDAALGARCWERWRENSFNKWYGEFALIIWDKQENQIIAARHQFGGRTLNYHQTARRLVIASAPKGIHAIGDIERAIDEQKIADALCQLEDDGARTFFKDINRLLPANLLIADNKRVEIRQYYDYRDHSQNIHHAKDSDYVEEGRELLKISTKARMRSAGPVGAFMSGGLDSSAVAVTAAKFLAEQNQQLSTFTWVPQKGWDGLTESNCYGDETPYVEKIVASHPGLKPHFIDAAGLTHYHKQEELLVAAEMPVGNALNAAWCHAIMAQANKQGISVLLEGQMGNLTLSYRGNGIISWLWQQGAYRQMFDELMRLDAGFLNLLRNINSTLIMPYAPNWMWDIKERLRGRKPAYSSWQSHVSLRQDLVNSRQILQRSQRAGITYFSGKPVQNFRENWMKSFIHSVAPRYGDIWQGFTAIHNVEVRDPFFDRRIIEWSMGVPEDQFYRNGEKRWLFKRMMKNVLPEEVLNKPFPIGQQMSDWHFRMTKQLPRMRQELKNFKQDPDLLRLIDFQRLEALLSNWPKQTIVDRNDDRRYYLPGHLPATLQIARFVQKTKGVNLQQ